MKSCKTIIEPRLIALLNDTSAVSAAPTCLELPPLQKPSFPNPASRPLLLEPVARELNREHETSSQINSGHSSLSPTIDDENLFKTIDRRLSNPRIECTTGDSTRQSLNKILDLSNCDNINLCKKRNQVESNIEEFVQLPRPTKKQKAAKQVVPPIIIGLFQPPPQSSVFPPIASSCFPENPGRNSFNTIPHSTKLPKRIQENKPEHIIKRHVTIGNGIKCPKNIATRKKWTEEETNNLLLGIHKHGVGCWADILHDSCFVFNERSSSDLKDRWRTCCPDELRKRVPTGVCSLKKGTHSRIRSGLASDKAHTQDGSKSNEADSTKNNLIKSRKRRSHRKKLEDLFRLGINGPLRQSSRRERRKFTKDEDCAILEGYNTFGPAWSKIQKDPRLNLLSRQPTDLRDRFRNKFKDKFLKNNRYIDPLITQKNDYRTYDTVDLFCEDANERGNQVSAKNNAMKSTQTSLQSFPSRDGLRIQEIISSEPFNTLIDQPSIDSVESLPFSHFSEWSHSTPTPFSNIIGDMEISRLILDENWSSIPQCKEKLASSENLLLSGTGTLHQLPSLFSISNEVDDLTGQPFG
ncbi:Telobox protein 1 [Erysiphe necator]|nr:Telobox protein 1 [Erysiphe necator]